MNDCPADNLTFEQALLRLEQIVRDLEEGETGLEESLAQYERGIGLLKQCYGQLRQAEQRILLLSGVAAEGQPELRPFEHAASPELAKNDGRRARQKPDEPDVPF